MSEWARTARENALGPQRAAARGATEPWDLPERVPPGVRAGPGRPGPWRIGMRPGAWPGTRRTGCGGAGSAWTPAEVGQLDGGEEGGIDSG